MSDTAAAAPAAAPSNGAAPKATTTPTPTNGATATGPQGAARGPDGKFAPTPKAEVKPELVAPKAKLKIKDFELDEEAAYAEIMRGRQSSKHMTEAQKRLEAADRKEKEQEARAARWKEDPSSFFSDHGLDDAAAGDWASRYINERHIKPSQMTEQDRALAERDAKIAKYEAAEKERAAEADKAEQETLYQRADADIRKQVGELLRSGQVPQTPGAVKRVVEKLAAYEAKGVDVDPGLVAKQVRDEFAGDTGTLLESTSVDELAALWGQERMAKIATNLLTSKGIDGFRAAVGKDAFKSLVRMFNDYVLSGLAARPNAPRPAAPAAQPAKADSFVTPADYLMHKKG